MIHSPYPIHKEKVQQWTTSGQGAAGEWPSQLLNWEREQALSSAFLGHKCSKFQTDGIHISRELIRNDNISQKIVTLWEESGSHFIRVPWIAEVSFHNQPGVDV